MVRCERPQPTTPAPVHYPAAHARSPVDCRSPSTVALQLEVCKRMREAALAHGGDGARWRAEWSEYAARVPGAPPLGAVSIPLVHVVLEHFSSDMSRDGLLRRYQVSDNA